MKKTLTAVLMVLVIAFMTIGCGNAQADVESFHAMVSETQELLDIVADDIYANWHGAIYKDEYGGSIDLAIYMAQTENSENLTMIELKNGEIKELYKKIKDSDWGFEVKEVMHAYNEYYSFVVEVSGSFQTFKEDKEPLKKALATALKNLAMEI